MTRAHVVRLIAAALLAALAARPALAANAVSVRSLGARGDGRTNDSAAFRRALAVPHRTVHVPAGDYLLGPAPLVFAPGVRLTGDGPASALRLAKGAAVLLQLARGAELSRLRIAGGAGRDGASSEPGVVQLGREASFALIDRVAFRDCRRVCIATANTADLTIRDCDFREVQQAVSLSFSRRVKVINNTVVGARLHGLQFWGNWKWSLKDSEDLLFQGNIVRDGGGGGIWGAGTRRVVVTGNIVDGAADVGIDLEWCEDSVITGNSVRNTENGGIALFFACRAITISGNTIRNDRPIKAPGAAWWVRSGIWLTYPDRAEFPGDHGHRDVTIVGNTVTCAEGERHCISVGAESDNIVIQGNALRGGASAVGGAPVEQPITLRSRPETVTLAGPPDTP